MTDKFHFMTDKFHLMTELTIIIMHPDIAINTNSC